MNDRTKANHEWFVAESDGTVPSWKRVGIAVLMDIRRELRLLNALLSCPNFTGIPDTLRSILRNTEKTRKRASKKKVRRA